MKYYLNFSRMSRSRYDDMRDHVRYADYDLYNKNKRIRNYKSWVDKLYKDKAELYDEVKDLKRRLNNKKKK